MSIRYDFCNGIQGENVQSWWLYLIRTARGDLYCGVTTDVDRRFREHCSGSPRAAKFLRGRGPLRLEFQQAVGGRSQALKMEYQLKRLPKKDKEALICGAVQLIELLS